MAVSGQKETGLLVMRVCGCACVRVVEAIPFGLGGTLTLSQSERTGTFLTCLGGHHLLPYACFLLGGTFQRKGMCAPEFLSLGIGNWELGAFPRSSVYAGSWRRTTQFIHQMTQFIHISVDRARVSDIPLYAIGGMPCCSNNRFSPSPNTCSYVLSSFAAIIRTC